MSTEELRRLATRAEGIEGRQAGRLDEIHGRIQTARRRRATAGVFATAGVVVAIVAAGAALSGPSSNSDRPPVDQTPDPNPTETDLAVPAGQTTILPEISPGDIRGWDVVGERTNEGPGDTDLSAVVDAHGLDGGQSYVEQFCHGAPSTWWVLTYDLDGVDGTVEEGPENGNRARFGKCSQGAPSTLPAATEDIDPGGRSLYGNSEDTYPLRMFVTEPLPAAAQRCLRWPADVYACLADHQVVPLTETDATFGFGVYQHTRGPLVLTGMGGSLGQEALAMGGGVGYLVDRAVVSAPDAERLVVYLPASDQQRLVTVVETETSAAQRCADDIDIEVVDPDSERRHQETFQKRCVPILRVLLDGEPVDVADQDFYIGPRQTVVPPGGAHEVIVEVVKNDPRNVQYAVIVWEERS
jgi:hypothetical protein